jgi:hypothetical protein
MPIGVAIVETQVEFVR